MISLDSFEVKVYFVCSGLLCFKVLLMALLIGKLRLKKEIFISPEDIVRRGRVAYDDPDIERMRRAHLNDLENIPIFLMSAAMYLFTGPQPLLAAALFVAYTAARVCHTYVYAISVRPQPARMRSFRSNGIPTLIVGHHILYGKFVSLEKPYAIMEKLKSDHVTEYIIKALVDKKIVFKIRPKPIIAAVPGC